MPQKIVKIGTSLGVIIPKDSALKVGWKAGDFVNVQVSKKSRGVSVVSADETSKIDERIMRHALQFIDKYRKDLEALARK